MDELQDFEGGELPDGAVAVNLDEDAPPPPPFSYDERSPNLVEEFLADPDGKKELQKIIDTVLDDFEKDWEGNRKWRERATKDMKLFAGELPPKDYPWEHAANPHVPIMIENVLRLATRYESEIFGDWRNVAKVIPAGMEDEDFADIVSTHLNWQIRNQIPDFKRQMSRSIIAFCVIGDVTIRSWWNPKTRRNCHDYLSVDEFVPPFSYVSTDPSYGDMPHYTMVCRYYRNQLQAMRKTWVGVEEVLEKKAADQDSEPDAPFREGMAKVQGENKPLKDAEDISNGAPYTLLHYEGWMELPNQQEDRWVQVIVDKGTRRCLSLKIHEQPDWQDEIRYNRQMGELQQFQAANEQFQAMSAEHQQLTQHYAQAVQMGLRPPDPEAEQMIQAQTPQPPPPPEWVKDPTQDPLAQLEPMRMVPILMFSHCVAIEPLTGSLGLGTGRILGDYNRAANVALSQFMDAATLANCWGLITSDNVEFDRAFQWGPGKINKARGVSGAELKDAVMPMQAAPANPQLLQVVQMVQQNAQAAAQAPDVLSGKAGKSGETFRGQQLRVENAVKQITVMGSRLGDLVELILRKNAELNAVYLSDEEFFQVTKSEAKYAPQLRVTRQMYQRNYEIELESDMRFVGEEQKVQEADQILQLSTAFQQLMPNIAFFQQSLARVLTVRKRKDLIPYAVGQLLPPPQTPLGMPPMMGPPGAPPPGPPGGNQPPKASGEEKPGGSPGGPPQQEQPQGPQPPQPNQGAPN